MERFRSIELIISHMKITKTSQSFSMCLKYNSRPDIQFTFLCFPDDEMFLCNRKRPHCELLPTTVLMFTAVCLVLDKMFLAVW